jgi:PAS domain S-box-containing protein
VGYLLLSLAGFRVITAQPIVASVWPAAGFALAVLLRFGPSWWPGLVAGTLAAVLLEGGVPFSAAALIAMGNASAAVVAALALRRLGCGPRLTRVRDALCLLLVGGLMAPLISATLGTLVLGMLRGPSPWMSVQVWSTWWSGDAVGVFVVTPLLLTWFSEQPTESGQVARAELELLGIMLVVASLTLLRGPAGYEYAVSLLVGWAAVRFGPRGASAAVAFVATAAVWYTIHDIGPFVRRAQEDSLWRLQVFIALLAIGGLVLSVMAMRQTRVASALRASELRVRRIFEHAGVGISVVRAGGRFDESNPALQEMLGYSGRELSDRTVASVTRPDDMALEEPMLADVLAGRRTTYRMVKQFRRKDGSTFPGKVSATHVPGDRDGAGYAISVIEDISEQRLSEEALRRTTQMMRTLIDAAPLAIYALDTSGRLRSWNPTAERIFGWSTAEAVGRTPPFVPPESLDEFLRNVALVCSGQVLSGLEVRRRRRDGTMVTLHVHAAPTRAPDGTIDGIMAVVEDVTERLSLGEQLRQAQKMEAIGLLTGGIAHDFNNLLTVILTNADLLVDEQPVGTGETRAEWAELRRATLRGAELVRKLMDFSRQRALERRPLDLADVVSGMEQTLRRLLPDSVVVTSTLGGGGPMTIQGDDGAIEQILLNLGTNAQAAMPNGGTITLRLSRTILDEEQCRARGAGKAGPYVVLEVSDTGSGMTPEVRARVFEPFFTTKEMGKGTGLGMAMVYGLVKQHEGFIELDSEPGRGTTVRMHFPAASASARPAGSRPVAVRPVAKRPPGGTERILVVDDEEGVRRTAVRVLSRHGYQVEEAADGEQALERVRNVGLPFDLVLSDLAMPRMNGLRLYEALRERGIESPVLLMSGNAPDEMSAMQAVSPDLSVLQKPWSIPDLLQRVREMIDRHHGTDTTT